MAGADSNRALARASSPLIGSRIALTLSGGGVRAMLFHLGVLTYLAERSLLEKVAYISTVSGGTLVTGLVFHFSDYRWPSSKGFLDTVLPSVEDCVARKDLQLRALARFALIPTNWRHVATRANVLADAIRREWQITAPLSKLPKSPVWAINATTIETGHRWRFRAEQELAELGACSIGDRDSGYTFDEEFPLAEAMATSAAFPGGISPLVFGAKRRSWYRQGFQGATRSLEQVQPLYANYHLADGGVYDNLGLEPVFDASARKLRQTCACDYIIAVDAGAPLKPKQWGPISQLLGFSMRTIDIMRAQQRHLRVRSLVGAIVAQSVRGIFVNAAEPARVAVEQAKQRGIAAADTFDTSDLLSPEEAARAAAYKTTLRSPSDDMRKLIRRHGYEVARAQAHLYGGNIFHFPS